MRALLVHPRFPGNGFWNYQKVCQFVGAKYPAAPLGLVTVAALLPQDWEIRLVDTNARELTDADLKWADLVLTGGMLPQQMDCLRIVERAQALGKPVAVGGPDPTSQPALYERADYLVLGEGEVTIPAFLEDFAAGAKRGRYLPATRADMSQSPVPRFDLLRFDDYLMVGVQYCRGCPFNCEFCDIIELYGRVPRPKQPQQILAELDCLYGLGYRGHIDFVDDNFIGNRKTVKHLLRWLKDWSEPRHFPFYFSTEASINLGEDTELLGLMQDNDFRYVFVGLESADVEVLRVAQKTQNTRRDPLVCLEAIYRHGIVVNGGFIIGFDGESQTAALAMAELIQVAKLPMAMVGLLYALPNTQLERRLLREGRMLTSGDLAQIDEGSNVDQATSGLNFITQRPKIEILGDFADVIESVYDAKRYFDRIYELIKVLKVKPRHRPPVRLLLKQGRALARFMAESLQQPELRPLILRNLAATAAFHPRGLEMMINLMAMYMHFGPQSEFIVRVARERIARDGEQELAEGVEQRVGTRRSAVADLSNRANGLVSQPS